MPSSPASIAASFRYWPSSSTEYSTSPYCFGSCHGVYAVVTPDVWFVFVDTTLVVTLNVTVQPAVGIVIPVKLTDVKPRQDDDGVVPTHVPPTDPATVDIEFSVSLNTAFVSEMPLLFDSVTVT